MNPNLFLPPDAAAWLVRYGLFLGIVLFLLLALALLLRPFWLWYSGRSETNDLLRQQTQDQRKVLLELEILNQTLSIPLKKSAPKPASAPPPPEAQVITPAQKEEFLKALERSRQEGRA